jgi:DNA mismatch repair protein MutS2
MDERTFTALELNSLKELLAKHVQTPLGRRQAEELWPLTDRAAILHGLDLTSECADYLATGERFGLGGIEDPAPALSRLQIGETSLDPHQILALERLISLGVDLHQLFKDADHRQRYPRLAAVVSPIPDLRGLAGEIRGKILPGGEIDDGASPELRMIRREIVECRSRVHRTLESIMRNETHAVQDELVTFRNGRFVIPIRTDSRGRVPGVVHGLSSSGQTTFVEPMAVIDQNNDLVRLREQEEIEIARILFSISEKLREKLPAIRAIAQAVATLDFSQAKGRLSAQFRCVRPQLSAGRALKLIEARHILLEHMLRASGSEVVPISLELDEEHQVLVISGPNAGGKTIVLKTAGLIALMAQMGLHVPAREAILPVFDQVFADIGDQQSIAANLSTFTAHMRNISETARQVAPPALVLLDEVGTGTDPDEGAALAEAIVDFFRRSGATTMATTHYNPLKMWAARTEGVLNASVEFDEKTLCPTYRLIIGIAGASSGLEIARRMNVPASILDNAKLMVEPSQARASEYLRHLKDLVTEQEALRAALEEERAATASEYARLDLAFASREGERKAEFERALAGALQQFREESERLVRGLKDRVEAARLKKAAENRAAELRRTAERLRRESVRPGALSPASAPGPEEKRYSGERKIADDDAPATAGTILREIQEGDRVKITSLNKEGVVESVHEGTFIVMMGVIRFRASHHDLELLERSAASEAQPGPRMSSAPGPDLDQSFVPEINVIGLNSEEATERVDKFLDEAFLAGTESVRIIHGHGKGILRKAIAKLLTGHPQVEKFQLAPAQQGGSGATLVEIRK